MDPKSAMLAPRPQIHEICLKILATYFQNFKILQIFDYELWNSFFSNVQDTSNYIVTKFSATQLHPNLKANDLNVQRDAMTFS